MQMRVRIMLYEQKFPISVPQGLLDAIIQGVIADNLFDLIIGKTYLNCNHPVWHDMMACLLLFRILFLKVFMEDRLPNQICFDCVDQLLKSYNFKQLCEQSNRTLLKIASDYNKVKTEELEQIAKELTTLEPETDIKDESMEEDETNFENNVTDSETDSDEKDNEATENHIPKSQVLINHAIQMDGDKCEIKKLRCNICEKSFPTLLALARHMNTHQETRIITLNCKECGKGFSDPGNLTKHMNRHKGKEIIVTIAR